MITNLPIQSDYYRVAKQCLNQAFKIVYAFNQHLRENEGFVDAEALWRYQSGEMNTSLILIHQAVESLMKGVICSTSPLLLLEMKRHEWPSLPQSADKDFNELSTIGGAALVRTYMSIVGKEHATGAILSTYEEIRLLRNRIVHGVSQEEIYPSYIVSLILGTYTLFIGKGYWWDVTVDHLINSPLSKAYESDYHVIELNNMLNYAEGILPRGILAMHFELSLKVRRYFCPWCYGKYLEYDDELNSKWGVLVPQGVPGVTTVHCICCNHEHEVVRTPCTNSVGDCKGDVIFEDPMGWGICLSCGWNQA